MGYLYNWHIRFRRIAVLVTVITALSPFMANAETPLDIFKTQLPVFEAYPLERLKREGKKHTKQPFADKALAFSMYLPKGWSVSKSFGYVLSQDIYTEVARFIGPIKFNQPRSYIVVKAMDVGLQGSAQIVAAKYFQTKGFTIKGVNTNARNHIETLHVEVNKGESYGVRSLFMMNGGRLIMVSHYLPGQAWEDERDEQYTIMQSFALDFQVEAKVTERKRYEFWDLAGFEYPVNWDVKTGPDQSFDHMNVTLDRFEGDPHNPQKRILKGRLSVRLMARHIAQDLTEALGAEFAAAEGLGVVLKRPQNGYDSLSPPEALKDTFKTYVYQAIDSYMPNRKAELWVAGGYAEGYYYSFSLVTPAQEEDFMLWGENRETLQYILESLTLNGFD